MQGHRNLELDRLRAFAALMVIFTHYANFFFPWRLQDLQGSMWGLFVDSWPGVDLFFVISGFIISSIYIKAIDTAVFPFKAIKKFFMRRFFRIFPVGIFVFSLVFIASYMLNAPSFFSTPHAMLKAGGTLLTGWFNFYYSFHEESLRIICPYWSLSLEEQFYFFFPFFLMLIRTVKIRVVCLIGVLLIITFYIRPNISDNFYYTQSRCDGILYGCLLYYFMRYNFIKDFFIKVNDFYLGKLLAIVLLTAIAVYPSMIISTIYSIPLIGVTAFLLVGLSVVEKGAISFWILNKVLDYIGARSYSLYLVHFPLFMLMKFIFSRYYHFPLNKNLGLAYTLLAAILIIITTEIAYQWIEKPFILKGKRINSQDLTPETLGRSI
jgi:peptidoglycan/LPS O-acetylase OafA/YrhL